MKLTVLLFACAAALVAAAPAVHEDTFVPEQVEAEYYDSDGIEVDDGPSSPPPPQVKETFKETSCTRATGSWPTPVVASNNACVCIGV